MPPNILIKLRGNMPPMIPTIASRRPAARHSVRRAPQITALSAAVSIIAATTVIAAAVAAPTSPAAATAVPSAEAAAAPDAATAPPPSSADTPQASSALSGLAVPVHAKDCLKSGDGYLRAHLAGAIDATLDWPNKGTRCEGESRGKPSGVRLSFQRSAGGKPNLLLVFGLSGVRAGQAARAVGTNLTIIVQGKSRIYATLGDSRCTVDSLTQRRLDDPGAYRVEARGFCTQPAHALRGDGDVLVSTFEFAGLVNYDAEDQ